MDYGKGMEARMELVFTRAREAAGWAAVAAAGVMLAIFLAALAQPWWGKPDERVLGTAWWALGPAVLAGAAGWAAAHWARQPYFVLSAVGMEIYDWWSAARTRDVIFWSEIEALRVEAKPARLVVAKREPAGAVAVLDLGPLTGRARALLAEAVAGIEAKRA